MRPVHIEDLPLRPHAHLTGSASQSMAQVQSEENEDRYLGIELDEVSYVATSPFKPLSVYPDCYHSTSIVMV